MAIRYCAFCRKQLSSRAAVCPHCGAIPVTQIEPVQKRTFLPEGLANGLTCGVITFAVTLLLVLLWNLLAGETLARYVGTLGTESLRLAHKACFGGVLLFTAIGAVTMGLSAAIPVPYAWEKKLLAAVLAAVLAVASMLIQGENLNAAISNGAIPPEQADFAMGFRAFYGLTVPLIQGGIFCLCVGRTPGKTAALLCLGVFGYVLLTGILCWLFAAVIPAGTVGTALAGCAPALVMLALGLFLKQDE